MDKTKSSSKRTPRPRKKRTTSAPPACERNSEKTGEDKATARKVPPTGKKRTDHLRHWVRITWRAGLVCCILCIASVITAEIYVEAQSSKKHSSEASNLPSDYVGLVLGCSPKLGEHENAYFTHRIKKAAELWRSGNVRCLIVSGDNHVDHYNEPNEMKKALVKQGVPDKHIVCDYAGLRTLDSVVRANKIFGADKIAIVSQEFHNKRALAIASHHDIKARALDAEDVDPPSSRILLWIRERIARVAMLMDLFLFNREPSIMGESVSLPPPPDRRPRGSYISF